MAAPKYRTAIDTNGSGISATSVSRRSIDTISAIATTKRISVLAAYITAGPIIMRTAFRSLVARDIRSPVRRAWKYDSGSRWSCAKKSFRRSYSIWRETPMMMRRMRNRNDRAAAATASSSAA